jgi:hypothetical protein
MNDIALLLRAGVLALIAAVSQSSPAAAPVEPSHPRAVDSPRVELVGVGAHILDAPSVERLQDLGVRHVRTTLYWSHWSDRSYRQEFVRNIRRTVAAGLEPLVVVHQQPSGGYGERQRVYREFARFMAARAAEFPEIRYWQLWNEMDTSFTDVFGAGRPNVSFRQRGRHYAEMLELAYPAIKEANPRAVVVTGGIASEIDAGFLAGMYDGEAKYDVLAIHTYGFPIETAFRERGRSTRAQQRTHGDRRPLWNTEFGMEDAVVAPGWPSTPRDIDGYHLEAWRSSVESAHRDRIYDRVYGHVLQQGGDLSYDLVRSDGSPRPAYLWLRSWLHGS